MQCMRLPINPQDAGCYIGARVHTHSHTHWNTNLSSGSHHLVSPCLGPPCVGLESHCVLRVASRLSLLVFVIVQVKMVYYAAHDTNLLYVAELLDLKWVSDSSKKSGGKAEQTTSEWGKRK